MQTMMAQDNRAWLCCLCICQHQIQQLVNTSRTTLHLYVIGIASSLLFFCPPAQSRGREN